MLFCSPRGNGICTNLHQTARGKPRRLHVARSTLQPSPGTIKALIYPPSTRPAGAFPPPSRGQPLVTRIKKTMAFFEGCPVGWGGIPTGAGLVEGDKLRNLLRPWPVPLAPTLPEPKPLDTPLTPCPPPPPRTEAFVPCPPSQLQCSPPHPTGHPPKTPLFFFLCAELRNLLRPSTPPRSEAFRTGTLDSATAPTLPGTKALGLPHQASSGGYPPPTPQGTLQKKPLLFFLYPCAAAAPMRGRRQQRQPLNRATPPPQAIALALPRGGRPCRRRCIIGAPFLQGAPPDPLPRPLQNSHGFWKQIPAARKDF